MKNKIIERNSSIKAKFPDLLQIPKQRICKTNLTEKEIEIKEKYLLDDKKFYHIHHCLIMLVKIPYQIIAYKNYTPVLAFQIGLNIGRVQEILDNIGGIEYWWRHFKDELANENWTGILEKAKERFIEILGSLELLDNEELDTIKIK